MMTEREHLRNYIKLTMLITFALLFEAVCPFHVFSMASIDEETEDYGLMRENLGDQADPMKVSLVRDDGVKALIKEGSVYHCNTGISFYIKDRDCEYYEYCISGDGGKSFGGYQRLEDGALRLPFNEENRAEGLWHVKLRGLDGLNNIIKWSPIYAVLFDGEAPSVSLSPESGAGEESVPYSHKGAVLLKAYAVDEKSGIRYVELKAGEKTVYKRYYHDRDGNRKKSTAFFFGAKEGALEAARFELIAMDGAGNESRIPMEPEAISGKSAVEEQRAVEKALGRQGYLAPDKAGGILEGTVFLCVLLAGTLSEAVIKAMRRYGMRR